MSTDVINLTLKTDLRNVMRIYQPFDLNNGPLQFRDSLTEIFYELFW